MQIVSLIVLIICLALSIGMFLSCMRHLMDAMEYQHLLILNFINLVMAMLATFEVNRDIDDRLISPIVLLLFGSAVLIYQMYFCTFIGIIHGKIFYRCIYYSFTILGVAIMVNHGWLSVFNETFPLLDLSPDKLQLVARTGDRIFVIYVVIVIALIIIDGIRFFIDSKGNANLRKRAIFMISTMAVMEVLFVIASFYRRSGLLVVATVLTSIVIYHVCAAVGFYNTEAMAENILVKNMADGVVVLDQKNRFIKANPIALKLFPVLKDARPYRSEVAELFYAEEGNRIEYKGKTYELSMEELYNKELFIGTVCIARDVTMEVSRVKNAELRQEKALSEAKWNYYLMGSISHAIRTPLNVIIGTVDMTLQTDPTPQQVSYLRQVSRFSWQLVKRIDMLMNMMRLAGVSHEHRIENYKLNEKLYDLATMAKLLVRGKDIKLEFNVNPTMPNALRGNLSLIDVITVNLLSNSAKYTDRGSITVDMDYEWIGEKRIRISARVTDTGRGIKDEDKSRIFNIFERADDTAAEEGFGIGLYSVKEAIDQLGAELTIQSEYGSGSSFGVVIEQDVYDKSMTIGTFDMNVDPYNYTDAVSTGDAYSYKWPGVSALIVDDMDVNIEILDWMLSMYGVGDIKVAKRFDDALRLYRENDFDIVFLDYMMDDVNGIYMMERMKAVSSDKKSRFVVVTADSRQENREIYRTTFDGYLWKPIRRYRLEYVLNKLLPKSLRIEVDEKEVVEQGKNYLIPIFCKEAKKMIENVPGMLERGEYVRIAGAVHGIKGACMELGIRDFAKYAQFLEKDLRDGHHDTSDEAILEFVERTRKLVDRLSKLPTDEKGDSPGETLIASDDDTQDEGTDVTITGEWVDEVEEYLSRFDYDAADEMLRTAHISASGEKAMIIEDALEELENLEYEKAADILQSLRKRPEYK